MTKEKDYKTSPNILEWQKKITVQDLAQDYYEKLPRRFLCQVSTDRKVEFLSVLFYPFFAVNKEVYQLFSLFEPNMKYKELILLESKEELVGEYFLPLLPKLTCISQKTIWNWNHSEPDKLFLEKKKIADQTIFILNGIETRYIIIRLDLAESMLRRGMKGFTLQEVQLEEGRKI